MALYMSDSREWREEKVQARDDTEEFTRFTPLDRFLHGLVIIQLPAAGDHRNAAQVLLHRLGQGRCSIASWAGQAVAAVLHRVGALITIFYFTVHVSSVLYALFIGRESAS